jgi:hypothetical protein
MSVMLVQYDLYAPGQDYTPLIKAIESYTHSKCLKSAYFIDTQQDSAAVRDKLMKLIDGNDMLYVMELKKHWAANRSSGSTDWLKHPSRTWSV